MDRRRTQSYILINLFKQTSRLICILVDLILLIIDVLFTSFASLQRIKLILNRLLNTLNSPIITQTCHYLLLLLYETLTNLRILYRLDDFFRLLSNFLRSLTLLDLIIDLSDFILSLLESIFYLSLKLIRLNIINNVL